jgi:IclR family transcriptional regulator, pca regulon regulatory protein
MAEAVDERRPDERGPDEHGPEFVQSMARGLAVIKAFDETHRELTLSEVAAITGLARAAARRFLLTLAELGYVRNDGRMFALTPRVLELGYAYLSSLSLPQIAEPHLERLVAEVQESASVTVLDDTDIVYVARVPTARIMRVTISIGTRFPAYATSMGRVLLAALAEPELEAYLDRVSMRKITSRTITDRAALRAELDQVRAQGWAVVDQELEEGLRSLAAPITGRDGKTIAAANIATHAARTTAAEARRTLLPVLIRTAEQIGADLRAAGSPGSGLLRVR